MKSFLIRFVIFSILLAIALYFLGTLPLFQAVMFFAWLCYGLFFLLTGFTFWMAARSMKGRFQNFMNVFFLGIILKLFLTGAVVVIYKSTAAPDDASTLSFVAPFALIYFSFLAFETTQLVGLSKAAHAA